MTRNEIHLYPKIIFILSWLQFILLWLQLARKYIYFSFKFRKLNAFPVIVENWAEPLHDVIEGRSFASVCTCTNRNAFSSTFL